MQQQYDFPWEREVAQKNKTPVMPDGISGPQQAAFEAMRYLYASYNLGKISKERASQEKKMVKRTLELREKGEAFSKRLADYHNEVMRKAESYLTAYRKAKTPEEAIQAANGLVEAIDGIAVRNRWEEP